MEKKTVRETVTEELCAFEVKKNVRYPFLSGIIRGAGELHFSANGFILEIKHKNRAVTELCADVLKGIYGNRPEINERDYNSGQSTEQYYSIYLSREESEDILKKCRIVKNKYEFTDGIPEDLKGTNSAIRAYLRGLYLACGSIRVPEEDSDGKGKKSVGYTLSFNLNSDKIKEDFVELLAKEAMIEKTAVKVKSGTNFVYIKNSEAVCNVLTALGSVRGALDTYGIIAERQMLNNVNRVRNCDMANIDKTVKAVGMQLDAIRKLEETGVYGSLSKELKETCRLRRKFPDLGIEQLGKEFNPPIGKSCLNHRLRRICSLAGYGTDGGEKSEKTVSKDK